MSPTSALPASTRTSANPATSPRSPSGWRKKRRRRRATTSCCERAAKPVIVLVRPQLGQNIGKAARAMLNFGLTEMRLVSPRDGWPNPDAGPAASGADLCSSRRSCSTASADAIADCSTCLRLDRAPPRPGHAGRRTRPRWPSRSPSSTGRSAILFGPERSGLADRRRRARQLHRHCADQPGIRLAQPRPGGNPARI